MVSSCPGDAMGPRYRGRHETAVSEKLMRFSRPDSPAAGFRGKLRQIGRSPAGKGSPMFRHLFWAFVRGVLSLRYRVRVHGLEQLRGLPHPVLVLPNHPGYCDPPIVLASLWPVLKPRPLVFDL